MSLSEYLLLEIGVAADRPSVKEWRDRLARRQRSPEGIDPAGVLREERDRR